MKYLTLFVGFFFFNGLSAQIPSDINPCGTKPYKSSWLKAYQKDPSQFTKNLEGEIYIPINLTVVGTDEASGLYSETNVLKALCTLSEDFSESDIVFTLNDYRILKDDEFFEHETATAGGLKMLEYNLEGGINCYVVGDPAGNCGYNLPYAGIALNTSCMSVGDHTWAHELGHALSIMHPFLGWEGGVGYDGMTGHNFNDPAPEYVLYDYTAFKDSLILDTLIIDTAYVELMDGSNCHFAADGFCDTAPDYLASRWACDGMGLSYTEQTDPNGEKFYSDASLIMSYGFDACATRFTEEQKLAMRANALDEYKEISTEVNPSLALAEELNIVLNQPYDSDFDLEEVEFSWESIENADYYLFQMGIGPDISIVLFDTILTNNDLTVESLSSNFNYLWAVTPFTKSEFCKLQRSEVLPFEPSDVSSTLDMVEISQSKLERNIVSGGDQIRILSERQIFENYIIFDASGIEWQKGTLENQQTIELNSLSSGMYFLTTYTQGQIQTFKFFVL